MGVLTEHIHETIEQLGKAPIDGCITGSSLLDVDFDQWSSRPDIDIFCYSYTAQVHAIDYVQYVMGFKPGKREGVAEDAEKWKIDKVRTTDYNTKKPLSTVSLYKDDVTINISFKPHQTKAVDVITNFDMTIIMKAIDIPTGYKLDMTGGTTVASPNPLRKYKTDLWTVAKWARQYDRVIKYWDRGFDTRPMAEFYVKAINDVIDQGALFTSDKSIGAFEAFVAEFQPVKEKMEVWLADRKEL